MLSRLVSGLSFCFYKTKWTYHLPRKHPDRPQQALCPRWTIIKGDTVQLLAGDDRGKVGKVVKVLRKLNRVVVRGINIHEYTKKLEDGKRTRAKKASSVHVSNVGLYDAAVKKAVRVKVAFNAESGEKLRISKKSGKILYKSRTKQHKRDRRGKKRKVGLKDTPWLLAHKVTYQGENFQAIRQDFEQFIAAKEAREKLLVFKE